MNLKFKLDHDLNICSRRQLMLQHIKTLISAGHPISNYSAEIIAEHNNNGGNMDEAYITVLQQKIIELGL